MATAPTDRARLADPMLALKPLRGLVVIDEVNHAPGIFAVLRVLADRPRRPARFLALGSASPDLLRQSAETLAGRIVYHALTPLSLAEVGETNLQRLWRRGGFPASYVARSENDSVRWRKAFVRTFLERDIADFGLRLSPVTLERFWAMLAQYHAQIWNGSELARAFGVSDTTVRGYLDTLTATFVVRQLRPWSENIGRRQVRSPKIFIADSGLLHTLLGIASERDLERHPKIGASWEGFALAQVIARLRADPEECYFWATHQGAELDLLVVRGSRRRAHLPHRQESESRLLRPSPQGNRASPHRGCVAPKKARRRSANFDGGTMNRARRPLIAGNWKMNHGGASACTLAADIAKKTASYDKVDVLVAPPFTALAAVAHELEKTRIAVSAQNLHPKDSGAFTGEVSAPMLLAKWVILGHSERRQFFGETDASVAEKIAAALAKGLRPIACVGETLAEREAGDTLTVVSRQIDAFAKTLAAQTAVSVIAYEPVWAIGTGKVAGPEQAQEVHAAIRAQIAKLSRDFAEKTLILYGGSVKGSNAAGLLGCTDVDGALVGGASLDAADFAAIAGAAQALAIKG
jgi:triosephosphate isomerase